MCRIMWLIHVERHIKSWFLIWFDTCCYDAMCGQVTCFLRNRWVDGEIDTIVAAEKKEESQSASTIS